jgi:hypothetical protein
LKLRRRAESFELDGRDVTEAAVQALTVKPADPLSGLELKLRARAPHAIGDQLGLVGIHERLGERIVVRIANRADRRQHVVIVEHLGVVLARILPGLNRSSQQWLLGGVYASRVTDFGGSDGGDRIGDAAVVAEARPEGGPERR